MLNIDSELLSLTSQSPYRTAFDRGYRWLRFEGTLEREFQAFYTEGHLVRVRLAAYLATFLFALFAVIDLMTLPQEVSWWTVRIRFGMIIPSFLITLALSYVPGWRRHIGTAMFGAALITGIATVILLGIGLKMGAQIPYEGILLIALFIYLIACLQWWRALFANLVTLAAFIAMEVMYQTDPQARLYQIVFMCAANAVGAYGGYFLEHSARTMFLINKLLNELAELDGLTGLSNRRTLNLHLDRIWRQAMRDQQDVAVAMIDIDHFKKYNDRYGHAGRCRLACGGRCHFIPCAPAVGHYRSLWRRGIRRGVLSPDRHRTGEDGGDVDPRRFIAGDAACGQRVRQSDHQRGRGADDARSRAAERQRTACCR